MIGYLLLSVAAAFVLVCVVLLARDARAIGRMLDEWEADLKRRRSER
jgi:hypothetical protein